MYNCRNHLFETGAMIKTGETKHAKTTINTIQWSDINKSKSTELKYYYYYSNKNYKVIYIVKVARWQKQITINTF